MRHRSPIGQEASTTEKMLTGAKRRGHVQPEGPHREALGPTGGPRREDGVGGTGAIIVVSGGRNQ